MALRIAPRVVGDIVEMRGPRGSSLTATAPDGLLVRIPAPTGHVALWVPQVGEWAYMWDAGPSGTLTVLEAPEAEPDVDEPVVPAGPAFTYNGGA